MFGQRKCSIIGMVHVQALPGAAGYRGSMDEIIDLALKDVAIYADRGIDAILIENMHDVPYLKGRVEPETTAAMTAVVSSIKKHTKLPLGVQILAGANLEALAVAVACGIEFLRVEGFVYAHVADEGIHESCAGVLIRRRAQLKAENVKIFADVKKKHSAHVITGDVSLLETAQNAEFFKADGVVITGSATGLPAHHEDVMLVKEAISAKVLVGSGISSENVRKFMPYSDGLIIGTDFKQKGHWSNPVDPERVARLLDACDKAAV